MSAAASATPSGVLPGQDGKCGYQHNMEPCLPYEGGSCCSINGYCGSNETYCLTSNGCQYGCIDPSSSVVPTPSTTLSSTVPSKSTTVPSSSSQAITTSKLTATTTNPASASGTPSNTSSASHKTPVADVAGGTVGGIALLIFLFWFLIWWWKRHQRNRQRNLNAADRTTPRIRMSSDWRPHDHGDTRQL